MTKPQHFPETLWRKRLIQYMKKLDDDCTEYHQVIRRNRKFEEAIIAGRLLQDLLHIGFLIGRQYWPWPTHLHWAFSELTSPAADVLPYLEILSGPGNHNEKLEAVQKAREAYVSAILDRGQLPAEILNDLIWAERLEAWDNSNWRDRIVLCQDRAVRAGYPANAFWVWSLWGWTRDEADERINDKAVDSADTDESGG